MKHTSTEIIEALKVIQDECKKTNGCSECVFFSKLRCGIMQGEPHTWELSCDEWKAFI